MKIVIAAMRSWGELGNWMSAKVLQEALLQEHSNEVHLVEVDKHVPRMRQVGDHIKGLAGMESHRKRLKYIEIMTDLLSFYPKGFEDDGTRYVEELSELFLELDRHRPDALIGTKGIITRCLIAYRAIHSPSLSVINYVTNHGHFLLPLHHCPQADLHIARLPLAASFLEKNCGFSPDKIAIPGYLTGKLQEADPINAAVPRCRLLIFSNRGGPEYVDLLRMLTSMPHDVHITFIALNDPVAATEARQLAIRTRSDSLQVVTGFDQLDYLSAIKTASANDSSLLVTKASPNAMFEAFYHRLPVAIHPSGLPMEDWTIEFAEENECALVATSAVDLYPLIERWLTDETQRNRIHQGVARLADSISDQRAIADATRQAITATTRGRTK